MKSRSLTAIATFFIAFLVGREAQARVVPTNLVFKVGEKLEFRLYWGIIPVGTATIATKWVKENEKVCLAISMRARTGAIVSQLYPVDDNIESIVDPNTFLLVRFTQTLREGKKRRKDHVFFDHEARVACWTNVLKGVSTNIPIAADTRDLLSLVFHMRGQGLAAAENKTSDVLVDEKIYELNVSGLKKEKVYLSNFGYIPCLKLEPKAKFGEVFVRKGKVKMWFSLDDRKVCTKITVDLPVANVKCILQSVRGPGDDFWTKRNKKQRRRRR